MKTDKEWQNEIDELLAWNKELQADMIELRKWMDNETENMQQEIRGLREQLIRQGKEIEF